MLNFIICDDQEKIRKSVKNVICKLMMPVDAEYKTFEFSSYEKEFINIINQEIGTRIYILDIEMGYKSGIDMAQRIREKDWQSLIIILTAHYELAFEAFKKRLLLLDFISKFDNYEKKLYDSLFLARQIIDSKDHLQFCFNRTAYRIPLSDIIYIAKDETERRTKIKTFYEEYYTLMSLNEISKNLNFSFLRTHRACFVNLNKIKELDYKNKIIIFKKW
jgi:two-component system, LytTR family, response regulator AgrA